jgi:hypothetical protein
LPLYPRGRDPIARARAAGGVALDHHDDFMRTFEDPNAKR